MKRILIVLSIINCQLSICKAQVGAPYIHDPSTIAECEGKYYTFGTGGGGLVSDDGWSWHGGAERPGGGAAPDVMKIGDRTPTLAPYDFNSDNSKWNFRSH